ncbi:MAG: hypothetical protein KF724_08470 [Phycisphaeraceae bacterium]|nr:hypothetical protein [Phycisphaeraceae bacterium]
MAVAQAPGRGAPAAPPADGGQAMANLPWPVRLGLRVADVEQKIAVMDRVVLVPDEATYLDEIARWSTTVQWPVLIEDDRWTPLFIRAFRPASVERRTDRAAPLPQDIPSRRKALESAVARAWGGSAESTPAAAFARVGLVPAGVVITSTEDPAWTAAVALAAGRGQLLGFLDGNFGQPSDVLDGDRFDRMASAITDIFRASRFSFGSLGDQLDACTICRTIAAKCTPNLPPGLRFSAPGAPPTDPKDPLAVTDVLCRNPNGSRYAFCGVIWGDSARSAYAAMCSLFLSRERFTFINSYGEGGDMAAFSVMSIQERFERGGYKSQPLTGPEATLRAWHRRSMGGFDMDVLFLNSSGLPHSFDLGLPGRTSPDNQGTAVDIPLLARPLVLYKVHSFSLQFPSFANTIGARWLDQGVYAYVGSVQEPFLPAFIPPSVVMERIASMVPFLIASRHWEGPFAAPWRVATIGDPLMLAGPPIQPVRRRLPADTVEPSTVAGGGRTLESLRTTATALMRACQEQPSPQNFKAALTELTKLGDDAIAIKLWSVAVAKGAREGAARAALGPLFRDRDLDGFVDALRAVSDPDTEALDMLWALVNPRFQTIDSVDLVDLLANNPRPMRVDIDLTRLAPAVARLRSRDFARGMLLRAAERSQDAATQRALREAASEFN